MKLEKKILETIHKYGMLRDKDRVLVACSGGPDSITLLHLLHRLALSLDLKILVGHVNHLLRGEESARDAVFVRERARDLGLEFYLVEVDVQARVDKTKESIQEAARELRYEALIHLSQKHDASKIALAHNADDQAETVLMNILRGTGPEGMGGIPPMREGIFVRPLIEVPRVMIEAFLKEERISSRHDSSNDSRKYLRNRIRLDLLPALKKDYNPALSTNLSESTDIFRRESAFMEKTVDEIWAALLRKKTTIALDLDLKLFRVQDMALQRRIIRRAYGIIKGNRKGLSLVQTGAILSNVLSGDREKVFHLGGNLKVRRSGDILSIGKFSENPVSETEVRVPGTIEAGCYRLRFRELKTPPPSFSLHNREAFFDRNELVPPLIVRSHQPGDTMIPLGMKGHKKLQDIFTNAKIPRHRRPLIPIITDKSGILWVAGIRRCARAILKPQTKNILQVEIENADTFDCYPKNM